MMNSGAGNPENMDSSSGESRIMSEYTDQLRCWLGQAYQWQCIPYVMPAVLIQNRYSVFHQQQNLTTSTSPLQDNNYQSSQPNAAVPPAGSNAANQEPQIAGATVLANVFPICYQSLIFLGRVYSIPKLSKRLLAEVIDFGLLFFIKALVTLTFLDSWNLE